MLEAELEQGFKNLSNSQSDSNKEIIGGAEVVTPV